MSVYDFEIVTMSGERKKLAEYKGKVLLIVNTATECGFTPQYDELQDLYEKYQSYGFEILDFPCNQFGAQAPGSNEEIVDFCNSRYGITFPQFEKIEVNGDKALPLYEYLKRQKGFGGFAPEHPLTAVLEEVLAKINPDFKESADIKWNFTKFLIDKNGNVTARFEPTEAMERIAEAVENLL